MTIPDWLVMFRRPRNHKPARHSWGLFPNADPSTRMQHSISFYRPCPKTNCQCPLRKTWTSLADCWSWDTSLRSGLRKGWSGQRPTFQTIHRFQRSSSSILENAMMMMMVMIIIIIIIIIVVVALYLVCAWLLYLFYFKHTFHVEILISDDHEYHHHHEYHHDHEYHH